MGAEARKARHKAHRTGRASRLRGSDRPRLDAVGTWLVSRRLPTSLVRPGMSPVCLSVGSDMDSQLSVKGRENGLDTRPPDGALARSHIGADHRLLPLSPADFVRSHRGRYLMPAVWLFVVAEDKAGLGRRPANSMSILLRSWWVWKVAVAGISCGTELLPLIVRFPFITPSFRVKIPMWGCAALP